MKLRFVRQIVNFLKYRMLRVPSKRRFTTIKEFQIIQDKKVGCGSFGTVKLARHRTTCRMYALKVINLRDMPSEAEVKLVERQIRLQSELDHPHIIKLWDTILQGDLIYMVMEYAEQGNLFYHQNTKSTFSEAESFKFFIQTLHGLQYLHRQNIMHRDIKPENLLLDSMGNIKICDFGWCAEEIKAKRTTFCGTYQYMAPQMLFKSQYDYRVDIWALGVLLYEMLHGYAPFKGKSTAEVKEAMLGGSYDLGGHLSEAIKDLIQGILQFQPEKRFSLQQILDHPWVNEMQKYLNNYLTLENAIFPKQIQSKIGAAPPFPFTPTCTKGKRRKNNSLNFDEAEKNININLEINNFEICSKKEKKNNFHSQQKNRESQDFSVFREAMDGKLTAKKNKMEAVSKSQLDPHKLQTQTDVINMLSKIKSAKNIKHNLKDYGSFEKKKHGHESGKKKAKLRKSQMEIHEKYEKHAIRFNTEANEDICEGPKLKKAPVGKSKVLIGSKSTLKLNKVGKYD